VPPKAPPKAPPVAGRPAGQATRGRRPQRRRAAYLALIGAGILVAAGVAVVLTMVMSSHIVVPPDHRLDPSAYSPRAIGAQAGNLSSVAFSPDGKTLSAGATGGQKTGPKTGPLANGVTYLWNASTGAKIGRFSPGGGAEAFSPDGTMLAAAGGARNTSTYLWQVHPKRKIAVLSDHKVSVAAVAFSANGKKLAVNGTDGTVHVWTVPPSGGAVPATVSPGTVNSDAVAFSPTGLTLAMGGSDGQAYLWNADNGSTRTVPIPGSSPITAVAFSPSGGSLAAGDSDGVTYIWNLARHDSVAVADPAGSGVNSVAFSPDGKWLATGDANGKTYLWHLPAGKLSRTLANPQGAGRGDGSADSATAVLSVAFDPDGTSLATTDTNGHAYLWPAP
jgi:eukaryotic-like serine/threonine-protein kinase